MNLHNLSSDIVSRYTKVLPNYIVLVLKPSGDVQIRNTMKKLNEMYFDSELQEAITPKKSASLKIVNSINRKETNELRKYCTSNIFTHTKELHNMLKNVNC